MYDERNFKLLISNGSSTTNITGIQKSFSEVTPEDIIQLTPKEMTCDCEGGTQTAVAITSFWWITEITCGNKKVSISAEERNEFAEHCFKKTIGWLTVEQKEHELHITTTPNKTGLNRVFSVTVERGDCFNTLTGIQYP